MHTTIKTVIGKKQIGEKITELAARIAKDYKGKNPVIIGVLTGAYLLTADFTRALWEAGLTDFEVDFVGVSSYGSTKTSNKTPVFTKRASISLANRHVLLVEDIIETGWSLASLRQELIASNPASLKTLVLLSKEEKRETDLVPDFVGFSVKADQWVEGYGLDTAQNGRGRPEIVERLNSE